MTRVVAVTAELEAKNTKFNAQIRKSNKTIENFIRQAQQGGVKVEAFEKKMNKATQGAKKFSKQTEATNAKVSGFSAAAKNAQPNVEKLATAVTGMSSVFGGLGSKAGAAFGALSNLGSAFLAGGPLLLGLAAATTAITFFIKVLNDKAEAAKAARKQIEDVLAVALQKSRQGFDDAADAARKARKALQDFGKTSTEVAISEAKANAQRAANQANNLRRTIEEREKINELNQKIFRSTFFDADFNRIGNDDAFREFSEKVKQNKELLKLARERVVFRDKEVAQRKTEIAALETLLQKEKQRAAIEKARRTKGDGVLPLTDAQTIAAFGGIGPAGSASVAIGLSGLFDTGVVSSFTTKANEATVALESFAVEQREATTALREQGRAVDGLFGGPQTRGFLQNFGKKLGQGEVNVTGAFAALKEQVGGVTGAFALTKGVVELSLNALRRIAQTGQKLVSEGVRDVLQLGTGGSRSATGVTGAGQRTAGVAGAAGASFLASFLIPFVGPFVTAIVAATAPLFVMGTAFASLAQQTSAFVNLQRVAEERFAGLVDVLNPLVAQASAFLVPIAAMATSFVNVTAALVQGLGILPATFLAMQQIGLATTAASLEVLDFGIALKQIFGDQEAAAELLELRQSVSAAQYELANADFAAAQQAIDDAQSAASVDLDLSTLTNATDDNTEAVQELTRTYTNLPNVFKINGAIFDAEERGVSNRGVGSGSVTNNLYYNGSGSAAQQRAALRRATGQAYPSGAAPRGGN